MRAINVQEINMLVEELIRLRDMHKSEFTLDELDTLACACNTLYYNKEIIEKMEDDRK